MTRQDKKSRQNLRALVIDDELRWRQELGKILQDTKFHVDLAGDSDAALTKLKHESYSLVTVNIGLPNETEIAWKRIAHYIRQNHPSTSIFIVTGDPTIGTALDAINHYFIRGYFPKQDFDMNLFLSKLQEISQGALPAPGLVLVRIADSLAQIGICASELSNWNASSEKDIQEVAYIILRCQYKTVQREVSLPPGTPKGFRCDFLLEDVNVIVEVKFIRNARHVESIQAGLHDDMVGYPSAGREYQIVFLIWDKERYIRDREKFVRAYKKINPNVRIVFAP